jgi:hypothetical protein
MRGTKYLHMKSTELCLASSKILTPHPPLHPASVSPPTPKAHTRRAVRGKGVNILEDARHWIGFLQYNISTMRGEDRRAMRWGDGGKEKGGDWACYSIAEGLKGAVGGRRQGARQDEVKWEWGQRSGRAVQG